MLIGIFPLGLINYFLWGFKANGESFIIRISIILLFILYMVISLIFDKAFTLGEKMGATLFFSPFYFLNIWWLCNILGAIITIFQPAEIHNVYVDNVEKVRYHRSLTYNYKHDFLFDNGKEEMFSLKSENYSENSCLKVKYKQNLFVKYIYITEKLNDKNKTDCLSL